MALTATATLREDLLSSDVTILVGTPFNAAILDLYLTTDANLTKSLNAESPIQLVISLSAANIADIAEGVTAYGWGNHASGGYVKADGSVPFTGVVSGVTPTAAAHLTTKDYVDSAIQGLHWQDKVDDIIDFTSSEPGSPSTGDRYINTTTGTSSGTSQAVTANYIYEWNGATWDETVAVESMACWVDDEDSVYVFNGTNWVKFGSTITHNNLAGLQGGTSNEYYHFTSAEHTPLTSVAGLTFASTSFVKMTGANTFALDTNTYITALTDTLQSVTDRGATSDVAVGFTTSITTPSIIGGAAVGSNIISKSTTGNGTAAGIAHKWTGGNNGATVIATMLNNGNVGIGTIAPSGKLSFEPRIYTTSGSHLDGIVFQHPTGTYKTIIQGLRVDVGAIGIGLILGSNLYFNTSASAAKFDAAEESAGIQIARNGQILFFTETSEKIRIIGSGNIGFGLTAPTAYLHIKAGTATAGTAPLKLTSGTLNTTPEAGAIEYDGTNLYFTDSGGTRRTIAVV